MLEFIKNIFAKKEATEEKISLDELGSWLDRKTKPMLDKLNIKIDEIIGKINDEKEKVNENLKTLENAQLQNPKIPERVKTIMQGNREGFIKKASSFFKNIDLNYNDYGELTEKCRNIENEINLLGKGTAKNYQILNEFFAREAEKVAANIKSIEKCLKELANAIGSSKLSDIDEIKSGIINLKNKIKLKESYSMQLESSNKNLQSGKNKKNDIETGINEIKSSSDYKNYEKLSEEKEKAEIKIKEIEDTLFRDFSVLEKSLKKYAKIAFEDEGMILEYLKNPIIALIKDDDFKILKVLGNLKSSIERDKLELEEKKKNKAIEKINGLDGVYFNKLMEGYKDAKKMLNGLAIETENSNSRKNLDSLNEELGNVNESIEDINGKIMNLNSELGKINIDKLRENLKEEITTVTNARIILG